MLALRIGRKPYDETHPYGHGRAEHIAAILVSFVIFASGAWILIKAIHTIFDGHYNGPQFIAVAAAVVTVLIKGWLSRYTTEVGKNLDSPAILAVAKDHRKDAVTSIATVIGVGGAYFGIRIMDPIAAGLTSFFIFHIGYGTFMDAAHDLMDGRPPRELIASITKLAEKVEGVEGVHEIRARRSGQFLIVDLKLDMDPSMTVKRSHAIATEVKKLIFDRVPNVGDVMIHVNPYNEDHEDLTRL
jgi:cation diffusion facilitator family transporter